jgi:hypothetical protein
MRQLSRAAAAIALIVGFAGSASAALSVSVGDELTLSDTGVGQEGGNGGGEFLATMTSGASAGLKFKTFCVELGEFLQSPVKIAAIVDGPADLDSRTALLFSKFWNGNLANYDHGAADQTALQLAIWFTQGQLGLGTPAANSLLAQYNVNAKAQQYVASAAGAVGTYGVKRLRLVNLNNPPGGAQDVLIVPEPASILAWSLIGGCFVAGHRIRRNKRALV